ncbi:MAG: hypothetical protein HC822_00555 [Oscillochloris sp.]|nr:hypothetical protein [Oscillochloris sp.]
MQFIVLRPSHMILVCVLLIIAGWAPPSAAQPPADLCTAAAVSVAECTALLEFYARTGGENWLTATNWLAASPNAPCDWFGVTCQNNRVTALELPRNQLRGNAFGPLPDFPGLRTLNLAGNQLIGPVPPTVCSLSKRNIAANLSYNALFSRRSDTRTCLNRIDPDWVNTQATPPRELRVGSITANSITITWEPTTANLPDAYYAISYATDSGDTYTFHGRTTNAQSGAYTLDGLASGLSHRIQVELVVPIQSANPAEVRSLESTLVAVTQTNQSVLLMVYFPADNDLSPNLPIVLERLRRGTLLNPNAQVVALMDGANTNDSRLLAIDQGVVVNLDALATQFGKNEVNSAAEEVLTWFITYARSTYPADREYLSIMGHGLALAPELAWPEQNSALAEAGLSSQLPALPKGMDATPGDVTDGGYMSTVALGRALLAATANGTDPLDLIFFDQCFQGNLDTLYEVRNSAEMFVASPNYAWLAAPYDEYLALMAPANTPAQVAEAIVIRYQRNLNDRHPNAIFAASATEIAAIAAPPAISPMP